MSTSTSIGAAWRRIADSIVGDWPSCSQGPVTATLRYDGVRNCSGGGSKPGGRGLPP